MRGSVRLNNIDRDGTTNDTVNPRSAKESMDWISCVLQLFWAKRVNINENKENQSDTYNIDMTCMCLNFQVSTWPIRTRTTAEKCHGDQCP